MPKNSSTYVPTSAEIVSTMKTVIATVRAVRRRSGRDQSAVVPRKTGMALTGFTMAIRAIVILNTSFQWFIALRRK